VVTVKKTLGANYWKLLVASTISNAGDGVSLIAYPWLASAITRNPLHIAGIGVASRIPWLVFSLPAGALTDRLDRRKTIIAMDVVRFALTLFVAVVIYQTRSSLPTAEEIAAGITGVDAEIGYLLLLYISSLLLGFAEVLRDNSAQTILPSIVEKDQLEKANGRLFGAEVVTNQFVGPPLGGLLLAIGMAVPFFFDAATFAVTAGLVFLITGSFAAEQSGERRAIRFEISEGFRWLWRHRLLRSLAIILGFQNFLFMLSFATLVLFAQEILGLNERGFGVLLVGGAVGSVLGSMAATHITRRIGSGTALLAALSTPTIALAIIGASSTFAIVFIASGILGFVSVVWNVITVSLRQTIIPDNLLGRVNSVYRFFGWGMIPLGGLIGGLIVTVSRGFTDRSTALRLPFFVAAAGYLVLVGFAAGRLSNARVDEAKAAAGGTATAARSS
jgi:MFS family permease